MRLCPLHVPAKLSAVIQGDFRLELKISEKHFDVISSVR